ncbi:MAG: (Fe-S)-binding protein [Candidatus Hodarchaeota archaeon]
MAIEEFKDIIHRCFRCGYCKFTNSYSDFNCPAYKKFRFETYSSGGKMWLIYGLLNDEIGWSENLSKVLYSCTTCGNCMENCKFEKFNSFLVDVLENARAEAFQKGFTPEVQVAFGNHAREEYNPYMEKHSERLNWLPEGHKNPEKATVAYFVGCTSSYREKELARNTYNLLKKAGIEFALFGDERCCGSPLLRTGQRDTARTLAQQNLKLYFDHGIKTVLTSCAGCYRTLKVDYPKITGEDIPFEVLHVSEYLNRLIEEGSLKFDQSTVQEQKVIYHDPCHLGRHSGLYDAPRQVLEKIPGLDLVEMEKIKGDATCCGAGGGVKAGNAGWALEMAGDRIDEAIETGASLLITTCPFCEKNFKDAIKSGDLELEVRDLVELVNERMK